MTGPAPISRVGYVPPDGLIGTFMGRDALRLLADALALRPEDEVILPAFACREAIRPFSTRARARYYDVRTDFSADLDGIRSLADQGRPRMLLAVNYFGFLQPERAALRALCSERGMILVEDCAHSLLTEGSGDVGDAAAYSFRKSLPVPDGGGLRVDPAKIQARPRFHPRALSDALALAILIKSRLPLRPAWLTRAGLESVAGKSAAEEGAQPEPGPAPANPKFLPLSTICRRGMKRARCGEIVALKRADYEFWRERVHPEAGRPVLPELPPGVCPLGFPLLARDRDGLKAALEAAGLLVRVHWRMTPEVEAAFPGCAEFSRHLLTLPVYPELPPAARDRAVRILARA